jgi:hypothetical protein
MGEGDRAKVGTLTEALRAATGRHEVTASECVRAAVRFAAEHPEVIGPFLAAIPAG